MEVEGHHLRNRVSGALDGGAVAVAPYPMRKRGGGDAPHRRWQAEAKATAGCR